MVYAEDELPPGWLTQFRRGVFSGAGLLLLAVAACTIPAFLVWLVPGADSAPASSAVKAGALLALAAAHGGIRLDGQSVTLAPLLVTVLIGWLVSGQARRSDSWSSVLGLSVGYAIGSGVLAEWAVLGATRAPAMRSTLAGFVFVAMVGGVGRALDVAWPRLSDRYRRLLRAAYGMGACYLGASAVLVAGSLIWHFSAASAIQRGVAPGAAGLPIAFLGVAAAPNALAAGIGFLTGPGVQLGSHTAVSAWAVSHGRLPAFPVTAAVPGSAQPVVGTLLIVLVALLAGWCGLRLVADGPMSARLLDVLGASVLTGGFLAFGAAVASGGIGDGALAHVGSSWWAVGAATIALIGSAAGAWSLVARLRPGLVAPVADHYEDEPTFEEIDEAPARPRLRSIAGGGRSEPAEPDSKRSRHVS